jgi:hypothetical protein
VVSAYTLCEQAKPPRSRFSPLCGTSLWNFQFPRIPFTGAPQVALISASSTGVGGGGRARGVFDVSNGKTMRVRDRIKYVDPNVPCKHKPVAHWFLLRFQGLTGWLPRLEPSGSVRNSGSCA